MTFLGQYHGKELDDYLKQAPFVNNCPCYRLKPELCTTELTSGVEINEWGSICGSMWLAISPSSHFSFSSFSIVCHSNKNCFLDTFRVCMRLRELETIESSLASRSPKGKPFPWGPMTAKIAVPPIVWSTFFFARGGQPRTFSCVGYWPGKFMKAIPKDWCLPSGKKGSLAWNSFIGHKINQIWKTLKEPLLSRPSKAACFAASIPWLSGSPDAHCLRLVWTQGT